jgi:hypothetical protein
MNRAAYASVGPYNVQSRKVNTLSAPTRLRRFVSRQIGSLSPTRLDRHIAPATRGRDCQVTGLFVAHVVPSIQATRGCCELFPNLTKPKREPERSSRLA